MKLEHIEVGMKVVPVNKSIGMDFDTWKSFPDKDIEFFECNGYLVADKINSDSSFDLVAPDYPHGCSFMAEDVIPYLEIGEKYVPFQKTGEFAGFEQWDGAVREFYNQNGYLVYTGIYDGNYCFNTHYDGIPADGDFFNPEDVYPYMESDNLKHMEVTLEEPSELCEPKSIVIDNVNSPNHYQFNGIETIDYINGVTSEIQYGYEGYLVGNILKYVSRYPNKNGVEDLRKAENYLNKLIEKLEK